MLFFNVQCQWDSIPYLLDCKPHDMVLKINLSRPWL